MNVSLSLLIEKPWEVLHMYLWCCYSERWSKDLWFETRKFVTNNNECVFVTGFHLQTWLIRSDLRGGAMHVKLKLDLVSGRCAAAALRAVTDVRGVSVWLSRTACTCMSQWPWLTHSNQTDANQVCVWPAVNSTYLSLSLYLDK